MGYTHHWEQYESIPLEDWEPFIQDCKKLYKNMPDHSESSGGYHKDDPLYLSGCFKYKYPKFNKKWVYFNGSSTPPKDRKKDNSNYKYWAEDPLEHETFVLTREIEENEYGETDGSMWSFCKTARKPYDLMVQAVLLLAKCHFKDRIRIPPDDWNNSDGEYEDWIQAFELVWSLGSKIRKKVFEYLLF